MSDYVNILTSDVVKKAVFFKMNDKRRTFILLKILDQILQDNQDVKNCIEKSITTICIEEGISLKQVFYILYILFFYYCISF